MNLIIKKVKYLDDHNTESYDIKSTVDFDTLGVYDVKPNGEEEFVVEVEPEVFREAILSFVENKLN